MEFDRKDQRLEPDFGQTDEALEFVRRIKEVESKLLTRIGRLLENHHDAEDALQETFTRGWQYRKSLKHQDKFYSWISRIAFNVVATFRNRQKKRQARLERFRDRVETAPKNSPEWVDPAIDPLARCQTNEIIESLPPHCRDIYVARFLFEFTNVDLARMFNLHENTIRARLQEAEEILEGRYSDEEVSGGRDRK